MAVDAFYSSCVYDLCACSNETACLCDVLSSYAKECAKAGVRLEWRSTTLCGKCFSFQSVDLKTRVGSHVVFAWIHCTDVRIHCTDILIECR